MIHPGNFGTAKRTNTLGGLNEEPIEHGLWNGNVQEIRQSPMVPSAYQRHLLDSEADGPDTSLTFDKDDVRFWSDYSRVYYTPGTMQEIPEPPDRERNWAVGVDLFRRYNEESDLMEGSVRLSLEECDTLQGLQLMSDCDSFGNFTSEFLTAFKDDYGKTTALVFAMMSGSAMENGPDTSNPQGIKAAMSDALSLRAYHDLASLTIPIQPPPRWGTEAFSDVQNANNVKTNIYYSSAILATHIETSTLPLRLGHETLPSFTSRLNWQAPNPFGELLGNFPLSSVSDQRLRNFANFTWPMSRMEADRYSRVDVTRGLTDNDLRIYDAQHSNLTALQSVVRFHGLPYPLPTSFPSSLWLENAISPRPSPQSLPTVKGISSLTTRTTLAPFFKQYAAFVDDCLRRKNATALGMGLDLDELREVGNDLWSIHDNYSENDDLSQESM
ncbi:hypothetical protein CC1G_02229 [Coprinopsis cinerea okayama7|uniref:DML1/Misato tubulin domain-containing protein n=1 Tax=Coprinopsis cinerea (strain Okayama-7 / 130 / ATCC MYA-4618 / FGSC 9003) TaxID=240176 RepID=A8NKM5_COPC7|nr:hypothetical protein CC1G_02229 [Coprinopsis cinerea okayama7\|eukprot:XP_001834493.2 hypothetical protein CC1G_02229 [Coprinopsis cinerea okayama7\